MHLSRNYCNLSSIAATSTPLQFSLLASTDILLDMVGKLADPKIGLVHQMPFTVDRKGLAATVEKVSGKTATPECWKSWGPLFRGCWNLIGR